MLLLAITIPVVADSISSTTNRAIAAEDPSKPSAEASAEDDQRRKRLGQLQQKYDREPDLARKIEYLREMKRFLDPYTDFEKIRVLEKEIRGLEKELGQQTTKQEKEQAILQIEAAMEAGRFDNAEQDAKKLAQRFPDDPIVQNMRPRVRTQRLVEEAKAVVIQSKATCDELEEAGEKILEATRLLPNHQDAGQLKDEINARLARCKINFWLKISLIILFAAGAIVGVYILMRPQKWILKCIYGPCKDTVFSLDKEDTIIGAMGPPEGDADFVVSDPERKISRRHCRITLKGRHVYLIDISANGTKVNDKKIKKKRKVRLRKGDEIMLADEAALTLKPE